MLQADITRTLETSDTIFLQSTIYQVSLCTVPYQTRYQTFLRSKNWENTPKERKIFRSLIQISLRWYANVNSGKSPLSLKIFSSSLQKSSLPQIFFHQKYFLCQNSPLSKFFLSKNLLSLKSSLYIFPKISSLSLSISLSLFKKHWTKYFPPIEQRNIGQDNEIKKNHEF